MGSVESIKAAIYLDDKQYNTAVLRADKNTGKFQKTAKNTSKSNDALAGSFRSAAQGVAVFDGPMGGVASRISSVGSLVSGTSLAVVGFGAAVAATALIMATAVSAGENMERQLYKQEAVLNATGYAAGFNAEQLDKMARNSAYATLASVKDMREAQNVMLTFKSVQGDVYKEAVTLTQDLAVVMGGTAASNAKMLGKALQDPVTGLSAMSKAGVTFSTAQKDMVKDMVAAGNVAEAQRFILAELQGQVGGVGAGEAGGLSGSLDTLGQRFETLFEKIDQSSGAGKDFAYVIDRIAKGVAIATNSIEEAPLTDRLSAAFNERLKLNFVYEEKRQALAEVSGKKHMSIHEQNLVKFRQLEADQAKKQLEIANQTLDALTVEQEATASKNVAAYQQSKETQARLERERVAELQSTREKAGLKQIVGIEKTLKTDAEKRADAHAARLAQVDALTLSEEQVTARNYASLDALRVDYRARLQAGYAAELAAIDAKNAAVREKERTAAEKLVQDKTTAQNRQMESAYSYFESVNAQYVAANSSQSEIENTRYQATLSRMQQERAGLQAQGLWSQGQEANYNLVKERATAVHEKKLTDIKKAEQAAQLASQQQFANIFVGMASSQNKTLAAIGKAAAIYNIGINTYQGAMAAYNALASIPYVGPALGAAAAGAVVAFGAEQIAGVNNQKYHTGGIAGQRSDDYGQQLERGEINAVLMRGEEVITTTDPRHRDNLQNQSDQVGFIGQAPGGVTQITNTVNVTVEASPGQEADSLGQSVAEAVTPILLSFSRSKDFAAASVKAVSNYARQHSGTIPGVR